MPRCSPMTYSVRPGLTLSRGSSVLRNVSTSSLNRALSVFLLTSIRRTTSFVFCVAAETYQGLKFEKSG